MNTINKTIAINAPAHTIFSYICEPINFLKLCSHMMAIEDIQRLPNGGTSFHWEYKMADVRFIGSSRVTVFIPNRRLTSLIHGGIIGTITWLLQPEDDRTRVTLIIEHELPSPLLQKRDEKDIIGENEAVVSSFLEALKATLQNTSHPSIVRHQ